MPYTLQLLASSEREGERDSSLVLDISYLMMFSGFSSLSFDLLSSFFIVCNNESLYMQKNEIKHCKVMQCVMELKEFCLFIFHFLNLST